MQANDVKPWSDHKGKVFNDDDDGQERITNQNSRFLEKELLGTFSCVWAKDRLSNEKLRGS